jgi:deoxyribonuclease-2
MFCCFTKNKVKYEIVLKYPKSLKYRIITSKNKDWVVNEDINEWVKGKYKENKWKKWVVYNDDNDKITNHGHCKGILSWNSKKIGWLIHSVPRFPEKFGISGIEYGQLLYGQSFIYIEFNIIHLDGVLSQLSNMNPNIYIGEPLSEIKNNNYKIYPIIGDKIFHISKHYTDEKDIYGDILIPFVKDGNCLVESWLRGQVIPESERVSHIKGMIGYNNDSYTETNDHSKFAVSHGSKRKWVFIGDLNRMESQKKRGGGGILLYDDEIHDKFMEIIR